MNQYEVTIKSQFCYGDPINIRTKIVKAKNEYSAKYKAETPYFKKCYKWFNVVSVKLH